MKLIAGAMLLFSKIGYTMVLIKQTASTAMAQVVGTQKD
jgi:hypothetical protein